jgi:hypothetical protein
MKIICLFLILLVISGYPIFCFFKPDEFCKKTLTKKSCMAFNCGTKFCVYDESSCMNLIIWEILMKKYSIDPKVYRNFLSRIKNCEKSDYKNQWSHRFSFG